MSDRWFVKKPCAHCPFRRDVKPFLRPDRAEEIAESTWNPYNDFPCHKTLGESDEDGELEVTAESLTCAGFLAMQISESGRDAPDGFAIPDNVYSDPYEMEDAYRDAWEEGE